LKVIRENCSEGLRILDRFHIVAKMNKALDQVRARESRRMASESRTPLLKKSRWLLLKREGNLKKEQRFGLRDPLRYNLKTVRAYLLKEAFQQLWEYNSHAWAGQISRRGVPPNHAFPHRAHEEDRPLASPASGANS
jgi:transposase